MGRRRGRRYSGLHMSLALFISFMAVWTPYRYLTGALGWEIIPKDPLPLLIESTVKLAVSFGLVYLFLRISEGGWGDVGILKSGLKESLILALVGSLALLMIHLAMGGELKIDSLGLLHLLLVVGPAEELVDRGYYFSMVAREVGRRRMRFPIAATFSSALFALSHLPIDIFVAGYDAQAIAWHLLSVFIAGMVLSSYYYPYMNLAGPSLVHAAMDVCSAYVNFKSPQAQFMSFVMGIAVLSLVPLVWWLIWGRSGLSEFKA